MEYYSTEAINSMNRMKWFGIFLALCALSLSLATATAQQATVAPAPTVYDALLSYEDAINLQQYDAAYSYWLNPRQTLDQFKNGFATTTRIQPYFGTIQPANAAQSGSVPAVLVGYHNDGSVVSYYGCFNMTQRSGFWSIAGSTFYSLGVQSPPDTTTISSYLNIDCAHLSPTLVTQPTFDTGSAAAAMLQNYYADINARDFQTAYGMWLHPIDGPKPNGAPAVDYRQPFNEFQNGYNDTTFVNLYTGTYNEQGASAGHSYLNGLMPVVVVGQHSDGTFVSYAGCYVIGGQTNGQVGIVSGKLNKLATDVPLGADILANLNIDCTSLGLSF